MTDITQGRGEDPGLFLLCLALSDCETRQIWSNLRGPNEARNLLEWQLRSEAGLSCASRYPWCARGHAHKIFLAENFCIWQRALPRSRFCHASRVREGRIIRPSRTDHHPLSTGGSPDAPVAYRGRPAVADVGTPDRRAQSSGAGGAVAARTAAQAAPDGYTLYMPASSAFVTLSELQAQSAARSTARLRAGRIVASQPFFLSVVSSLAAKSLPEFIALAKEQPGELSYAATGRGTLSHLTGEALQQRAGIKLLDGFPISAAPRRRSTTSSVVASRWSSTPIRR